jgi:integrase
MGIPLEKVKEQLGHESIETTANNYLAIRPEELAEAMDMVVI